MLISTNKINFNNKIIAHNLHMELVITNLHTKEVIQEDLIAMGEVTILVTTQAMVEALVLEVSMEELSPK